MKLTDIADILSDILARDAAGDPILDRMAERIRDRAERGIVADLPPEDSGVPLDTLDA